MTARSACHKTEISRCDFLSVVFVEHQDRDAPEDNGDAFTFRLTAAGGHPLEIDGNEVSRVEFTIVGPWELEDFFDGIERARRAHQRVKRYISGEGADR